MPSYAGGMEAYASEHGLAAFAKAAEALSYAEINQVDLFILDIQLLDYRGTELAKQLRSMPKYRFAPILFTTELARRSCPSIGRSNATIFW